MTPDAQALRYFLAVADELNFTHAAARLGIAQPALSAHIRRLEAALGVKVLDRTTRHVDLTPAGRVLADRGPAILEAFDALWEQALRVGAGETGRLALAYSASVGSETLPLIMTALTEQLPELRVEATVTPTPAIGPAVARGDVDAGLTRCAQAAPGTRDVLIRRETGGVLVSAQHPLARRRRLTLRDISAFPVLLHTRESNPAHHDSIVHMFENAGLTASFVKPSVSYDISHSVVRTTDSVAVVGRSAVAVAPAGTRWIPVREAAAAVPTYLVLPAGPLTSAQRRLEQTVSMIAAAAHWLGPDTPDL